MLRILKTSRDAYLRQAGRYVKNKSSALQERARSTAAATSNTSSAQYVPDKFQPGEVVQGFTVDEVSKINDFELTAVRLTHLGTGAQYLHLAADDINNTFCISFRTTPMDSTGLPHILEHTTLCGSERYPCRDPFFKMRRRSLANYMNAMTAPDFTMYPFSTQNLKDFRNLQSVYLDSVFKPNLRLLDFRQEGWRLEHENVHDKNTPIIFKGVVFNEMKGVFNENEMIFVQRFMNSILPSHTYAHVFGGDPLEIPNLRYEDLLNFHATYYHPSNSRFFSYGNFPLEDHLKFVNDRYLFLSGRIDTTRFQVPPERRWEKPKEENVICRPNPMIADPSRVGTIGIGQLCNDIVDTQTSFEMYVLQDLLCKGANSAFHKSMLESKLCVSYGMMMGYASDFKDTSFVMSLLGVKPEDFKNIEKTYDETLQKVIEEGFNKNHVDAVLHSIELQEKHRDSNCGLAWAMRLMPLWIHNADLVTAMSISSMLKKFRLEMENDPKYLQKLVEKYLLENPHRLTLRMLPYEKYDEKRAVEELELLKSKLKELSKEELDRVYDDGLALLEDLQKKETENVLPTLKIDDLKKDVIRYPLEDTQVAGVPLQVAVAPTSGVCYYRAILNIRDLSPELKSVLSLFNTVIADMGTQNYNYREFEQMVQLKTGGLSFMGHVAQDKASTAQYEEGVMIKSHCLDSNVPDMWRLWTELFNNAKLTDLERFNTLVKKHAEDLVNGIADSGHQYAMSIAAGLVSPSAKLKESLSGLEYITRMRSIAQMQNLAPVLDQMQEIAQHILRKECLRSTINLSNENKTEILKSLEGFYDTLKGAPKNPYVLTESRPVEAKESAVHYVFPFTVNYSSKAILTVPYTHPDYAALDVLSNLITSLYLHPEIREKGGAYGGGAKLAMDGIFQFYSYRDPNSTRTLDVFDKSYDFLQQYSLPQSDIDEAKLGVFQKLDAPVAAHSRGMTQFMYNLTYDDLQRRREAVKAVTKEQLMGVAKKYLQPGQEGVKVARALIGPNNSDLLNRWSENWTIHDQQEKDQVRAAT